MSLKLGTLDVLDVRLGTVAVARLVLGTEQVWPSGPLVPTGRVLAVESPDTAEIVGTVLGPVVGLVAAVESPHVADLAGTVTLPGVTGTIAVIEADDLASIVGASTAPPGVVVGPVVVVEADDLVAIVGTVAAPVYTGTIVALDDDDLAEIVGTVNAPVYTGAIVAVEADAFAALVGTSSAPVYTGAISITAADDASTIAGTVTTPVYLGAVAATAADDVSLIAGTSTAPVYTGTISATEEADVAVIAGTSVEVVGAVAVTEVDDASTIAGVVTSFPAVASTNSKVGTSLGAANAANMPTGITAGDLLVAFVAVDLNGTTTATTASAGWTQILDVVQGTSVVRLTGFAKIAAGGDTLSLTGSTNDFACSVHRITGHDVRNIVLDIVAATATNTTGNGDPPNLAPGSSQDFLWLAVEAVDLTTGNTITSVPTNYASLFNNVSASSTSSVALAVGSRALTGSAENPATFTNNPTTRPWAAATVSIARAATPVTGAVAITEADDVSLIAGSVPGGGGTVFTDNFNRADGPLGAAWTMDVANPWVVTSNTAHRNNADFARFATAMSSADHWVEADITNLAGEFLVLHARAGPTLASQNLYMGFVDPSGVATIGQLVSDGYSTIATGSTGLSTSGKVRFEVEGTTARLYLNGALVASTTVSGHATGLYVGMNASGNNSPYDNFRCGTLPYTP